MQSKEIVFFISGNTPSSKNSKVWTGKYFIPSAYTRKWVRKTRKEWEAQKHQFITELRKVMPPYYIEFTFIRGTRHKFDYINICQAPCDEMKKHGWLTDDDADNIKPYFADYIYDKTNPGLRIRILKQKPDHDLQTHT